MKVFEDLIDELREENLIEEPMIEFSKADSERIAAASIQDDNNQFSSQTGAEENTEAFLIPKNVEDFSAIEAGEVVLPTNENDYFRRRAMEEVSALQMVERVFSSVEREQLKVVPKGYDDIPVSKALHDFLQISKHSDNPDNASAEFRLMQETESWYSALSHRDQNILPAHLRRYCETARPALSSQALASLARFYRNAPFSESVRSKFDLIITKLFSKDAGDDLRLMAFDLENISSYLSGLYADWASVSVYSGDDDSELTVIALKFEDFISEAAAAGSFEEMIKSDFFNRVRAFKESIGENFYAPTVAASAVKCNISVGNRYVELLNKENINAAAATNLEEKYGFLLDQSVSEAASKTLQLVELLHKQDEEEKSKEPQKVEKTVLSLESNSKPAKHTSGRLPSFFGNVFAVNKWLMILMVVTIVSCLALYSWVEFLAPKPSTDNVVTLEIKDSELNNYLRIAKISNNNLIALAAPAWSAADEEKKQKILSNLLAMGKEKGYRSVRLLSDEGKTVGYLSGDSINASNK